MQKVHDALTMFERNFNCCQSILATYGTEFGLNTDDAIKLAAGFGGGISYQGHTCGAILGAYMIMGLKYASTDPEDKKNKLLLKNKIKDFNSRFKKSHGSLNCKNLLGVDITTEEGRAEINKQDLFNIKCPNFVKEAATILEEML